MTPHVNSRTPWKSIEDIKADYILDVAEGKGDCYKNAEAALMAVHAMNWNQCRVQILDWVQEAYTSKAAVGKDAA